MRVLFIFYLVLFAYQTQAQVNDREQILRVDSLRRIINEDIYPNPSIVPEINKTNTKNENLKKMLSLNLESEYLLTEKLEQNYYKNQWNSFYKTYSNYDKKKNKINELTKIRENFLWKYQDRYFYSYDSLKNLTTIRDERWYNEKWNPSRILNYEYNNNSQVIKKYSELNNNKNDIGLTLFKYNEHDLIKQKTLLIIDLANSKYDSISVIYYTYNENNLLTKEEEFDFDEYGKYRTYIRTYKYDSNLNMVYSHYDSFLHYSYYANVYSTLKYDNKNRLTERVNRIHSSSTGSGSYVAYNYAYYFYEGDKLVGKKIFGDSAENEKTIFTYRNNNLIKEEVFNLDRDGQERSEFGSKRYCYRYKLLSEANLDTIRLNCSLELLGDTISYPFNKYNLLEGKSYYFESFVLPAQYENYSDKLNVFEGSRFFLDEDAISEDISLDIRFLGMDDNWKITNPIDNSPLFMFMGIEVTGEQSGVTSFEDFYYFNKSKKARICIPMTERFIEMMDKLDIDTSEINFAYVKGGEYFTEGIEWEIKQGEENKPDSLCVYLDHFSKIVGGKNFITSIEGELNQIPTLFRLEQNYPNPFNPETTIKYSIPTTIIPSGVEGGLVELKIYDVLGREVKSLVSKYQNPGNYEVKFKASNLASGIYYYQLKTGSYVETKKMILMK